MENREEEEDTTVGRPMPPPWGDMETNCLGHVFRRLPFEDLAAATPLVCRSWHRAAADLSLWRALDLRSDHLARFMLWGVLTAAFARCYGVAHFALEGFLRLCVYGSLADLALPPLLSSPAAELDRFSLSDCAMLRRLVLLGLSSGDEARLPELIPLWRLLQLLELDSKRWRGHGQWRGRV